MGRQGGFEKLEEQVVLESTLSIFAASILLLSICRSKVRDVSVWSIISQIYT